MKLVKVGRQWINLDLVAYVHEEHSLGDQVKAPAKLVIRFAVGMPSGSTDSQGKFSSSSRMAHLTLNEEDSATFRAMIEDLSSG